MSVIKESTRYNTSEIILESLFSLKNWTKLNDELFSVLSNEFTYNLQLYKDIVKIEIIEDPFELDIYFIISGHSA